MRTAPLGALIVIFGCVAGEARAGVIVGLAGGGNTYPFSGAASDGVVQYQQVYDAGAFPGAMTIGRLSVFSYFAGAMDGATYTVGLSTTSRAVMGLDADPAANLGPDAANFGAFTLGGPMPAVLTLTGSPFAYDPALGNLLMTVTISGLTVAHPYESYFRADETGLQTSRLYRYGDGDGTVVANDTGALVTEFRPPADPLAAVPEPSTLALGVAAALLGWGVLRRRGRRD